jgi:hypothetical protein
MSIVRAFGILALCAACTSSAPRQLAARETPAHGGSGIPGDALALVSTLVPITHDAELDGSTPRYARSTARWRLADVAYEPGEEPYVTWRGTVSIAGDDTSPIAAADAVPIADAVDSRAEVGHALGATTPLVRIGAWFLFLKSDGGYDTVHLFDAEGAHQCSAHVRRDALPSMRRVVRAMRSHARRSRRGSASRT